MPKFKEQIKPSDFNVASGLMGSELANMEKEIVARNIIVISEKNGDQWCDFTFEDYKTHCAPRTSFSGEEEILDDLVKDGVINRKRGVYSVNERFFRTLAKFIKV